MRVGDAFFPLGIPEGEVPGSPGVSWNRRAHREFAGFAQFLQCLAFALCLRSAPVLRFQGIMHGSWRAHLGLHLGLPPLTSLVHVPIPAPPRHVGVQQKTKARDTSSRNNRMCETALLTWQIRTKKREHRHSPIRDDPPWRAWGLPRDDASCARRAQVVYMFAAELFPTSVRSRSIGLQSLSARVGGMLAPMVANLGAPRPPPHQAARVLGGEG